MINLCACNCGNFVTSKYSGRKFISGHNSRVRSQEINDKIGLAHRGKTISLEHRLINSKARKGIPRTEETKIKISQAHADGRLSPPMGNNHWAKPTIYNGIQMRSKLEARYAEFLDKQNIKWMYEPERFRLGNITYIPDFYLPETDMYIEVKGWNDRLEKVDAFRASGKNIEIIRDKDF